MTNRTARILTTLGDALGVAAIFLGTGLMLFAGYVFEDAWAAYLWGTM